MPEYFVNQLREGTGQVADSLRLPSAAEVRDRGERRGRRRRLGTVSATMSAVLFVGGVVFGVTRPDTEPTARSQAAAGAAGEAGVPSAVATEAPVNGPVAITANTAAIGGSVGLHLVPPAEYAAATANKVQLTIDNPGAARQVIVEFKSTQTKAVYWVEPCDSGADGGCSTVSYAENPLKVAKSSLSSTPGVTAFDLALPAGTSTYSAWVDLPAGMTSYTVLVLEGSTVLGQTSSGPIGNGFPALSDVGSGTVTVVRGGPAVEFDTKITNDTSASYVDIGSFTTLSCKAGQSTATLPQSSYTLQWYTGAGWAAVGPIRALGQFSFEINPGETTTTRFRLALKTSLPADVTSCQVTQLVSATTTFTPPYYEVNAPKSQTTVDIEVR